ncbi:MAG: radical SAM family heme chaperone HemW [Candidatus Omnitrophota bacterium]|nr:radical SAM family heme chaperone HemW [Candidatus Omnitrophota bacterium]MDZ4241962.1 radical SAM family heme chaperone HemW [Candidatus Omnitrophota bacterium]
MTGLYIHIPFCQKKCLYCSFVVAIGQEQRVDEYLDCLAREAGPWRGTDAGTVYWGGGTPSRLSPAQLERLAAIVRNNFAVPPDAEWTVECNPEDITADKARCLKNLGINRVSLGVQSFRDSFLKYLGRCHDAQRAGEAYEILRQAGFQNINLDLMFAFPQETEADLERDIRQVTAMGSEHVSLYTLTVEENSRFFAKHIVELEGGDQARQYRIVAGRLEAAGLRQYEVSNFAKPGHESRHNGHYWTGGDYAGLGVGAHSHRNGRRSWNVSRLPEYLARFKDGRPPEDGSEQLAAGERFWETFLLGLRMNAGVDVKSLENRFACALGHDRTERIDAFVRDGFLWRDNGRIGATLEGRLVLDEISSRLL